MSPGILSNTGAGVWRKASGALPDSSAVLDAFQCAAFGRPSGMIQLLLTVLHVILIRLGQELNLHLPLQCNSEFPTRED